MTDSRCKLEPKSVQ